MTPAQLRSAVAAIDLVHRRPRIHIALSAALATGAGAAAATGPAACVQVFVMAIAMLEAAIALRLQLLRVRETEATVRTTIAREALRAGIYQAAANHVTDDLAELAARSALPLSIVLETAPALRSASGEAMPLAASELVLGLEADA